MKTEEEGQEAPAKANVSCTATASRATKVRRTEATTL
jgi:hypothetical protein